MAEEKKLGVKTEEVKPAGDDQPAEEPADISVDIDEVLEGTKPKEVVFVPKTTEYDDKSVVISKDDLEKLEKTSADGEHYKKGLLSIKEKSKKAKEVKKDIKPEAQPAKTESPFLTKSEFQKGIEKTATLKACEDPEVNDNWEKVMQYYSARRGNATVEDIVSDIKDAKTLFRKYNPKPEEGEETTEEQKVASEVASEAGTEEGVKPDSKKKPRKKILGKKTGPETWY